MAQDDFDKKAATLFGPHLEEARLQRENVRNNLNKMVEYCETQFTCRRQLQLHYFGENFGPDKCGKTCDNCWSGRSGNGEKRDVSDLARAFVEIVRVVGGDKPISALTKIFRGSAEKAAKRFVDVPGFGRGKNFSTSDTERMYRELVRCQVLEEKTFVNPQFGGTTTHVVLGPNCHSLMSGEKRFDMEFAGRPEKTPKVPKERTRKRRESAAKPEAIEDSDDDLVDMPADYPNVDRTERSEHGTRTKDSDCISSSLQDSLFNKLMTVRQEAYDKENKHGDDFCQAISEFVVEHNLKPPQDEPGEEEEEEDEEWMQGQIVGQDDLITSPFFGMQAASSSRQGRESGIEETIATKRKEAEEDEDELFDTRDSSRSKRMRTSTSSPPARAASLSEDFIASIYHANVSAGQGSRVLQSVGVLQVLEVEEAGAAGKLKLQLSDGLHSHAAVVSTEESQRVKERGGIAAYDILQVSSHKVLNRPTRLLCHSPSPLPSPSVTPHLPFPPLLNCSQVNPVAGKLIWILDRIQVLAR
eukprot:765035-Hanusia_phi.AAC.16